MRPAIFFDKDGILNEVVLREGDISSPRTFDEFRFMEGARELVTAARDCGFVTVVATNQPDVTLGRMSREVLDRILREILSLGFDRLEVCEAGTFEDRRAKPNPGMLLDAAIALSIELSKSFFIGDHERDIQAGRSAGVKTILLETDYNKGAHGSAEFNFRSLGEIEQFVRTTAKNVI
jgi:D-glycero-D-manno-heptose 1,7-bisphosphate phosphatase